MPARNTLVQFVHRPWEPQLHSVSVTDRQTDRQTEKRMTWWCRYLIILC